jgi:hypothetical protein
MQFIRSFSGVAAAVATVTFISLAATAAQADVGISINGTSVDVSPAPIIQAGRVFVPLRGVFENLGASVVYDDGQINATGNGREISLHIGSTQATVDGNPQTIDVAPFIVGESTYVPLRFISQSLGASVQWDDADSVVDISMAGAPNAHAYPASDESQYDADASEYADQAPPPIPDYEQPPVPAPNDIWTPGYWAWGNAGYYWVPGTWVAPPQPGYLWTPGYWAAENGRYAFHAGFWATVVGFYGGINYGFGYFGHGYDGGRWSGDTFRYNTAVTRVTNTTIIRNVYVDRTVIVNNVNRVSYVGGSHGVDAAPTATEREAYAHHVAMTPVQVQHVRTAAADPRFRATVNAGRPPVAAVARPLAPGRPIPAAYAPAAARAPQVERAAPAPERPAAEPVRPAAPAPRTYAAPAERPQAERPQAERPQVERPAAVPQRVAPVAPAPRTYAAPPARPQVQRAAPAPARPAPEQAPRAYAAPPRPAVQRAAPAARPQPQPAHAQPQPAHDQQPDRRPDRPYGQR